jgi:transposase
MIVCDNLKSGVTKADRYEPAINRTYQEMARHYGTSVVPARPYKPRDKAKVEQSVLLAQRWVVARLQTSRIALVALSLDEKEQILQRFAANDRPLRERLTMAARNGDGMTEGEVDDVLENLISLGALNPDGSVP